MNHKHSVNPLPSQSVPGQGTESGRQALVAMTKKYLPLWITGATLLTGAVLAPAFAEDWPQLRGGLSRSGVSSEKLVPPLSLLWRFSAGAQANNPCAPSVVGDTVYFASRAQNGGGGTVFALDVRTGTKKWQYPAKDNGLLNQSLFQTTPLVADGKVFIGASDGYMYELDAKTGKEILRYRTIRSISSSAALVGGTLFFGSNDGTFYALNPQTGNYAWNQKYQVRDSITSAPIISDNMIFFTTADNTVHAVRQATGQPRWSNRLPGRIPNNAPVYSGNTIIVPAGRNLVALLPGSGNTRWNRVFNDDILVPPVIDNDVIYVIVRSSRSAGPLMYAVRSINGKDYWEKPVQLTMSPASAPTLAGNVLYIPTDRNKILAVSKEDGSLLWEYYVSVSSNAPTLADSQNTGGGFPGGGNFSRGGGGGDDGNLGGGGGGRQPGGNFGGQNNRANALRERVVLTAPVTIANGALYVVADDGSLSAFRPDAPDTTGPEFTNFYPSPGRPVSGQPPLILAAKVTDLGTGINPEKIQVKLDNKEVEATYDPNRSLMIYQTRSTGKIVDPPLSDGRHTVTITAEDWRGNKNEQTWSFIVDNSLPPVLSREAPQATTAASRLQNTPNNARPGSNRPPRGRRPGRNSGNSGNPGNSDNSGNPGDAPPAAPNP